MCGNLSLSVSMIVKKPTHTLGWGIEREIKKSLCVEIMKETQWIRNEQVLVLHLCREQLTLWSMNMVLTLASLGVSQNQITIIRI